MPATEKIMQRDPGLPEGCMKLDLSTPLKPPVPRAGFDLSGSATKRPTPCLTGTPRPAAIAPIW